MNGAILAALFIVQVASPTGNGKVTGRLLSSEGAPAAGVRVAAMSVPDTSDPAADAPALLSLSQTDSDGRYSLDNVPPGPYYITAGPLSYPTYYPGVASALDAKIVNVTAGATSPNLDFNLSRQITVKVSGRVIKESPLVPDLRQVVLLNGIPDLSQLVPLNADGTFTFSSVRPGSYNIVATPLLGARQMEIVVKDSDLNVDLTVPLMGSVAGVINVEGGGPHPTFSLEFTRIGGSAYRDDLVSRANGSITGRLPIGEYRLALGSLPLGYALKSIVSGSTDLTTGPLIVREVGAAQFTVNLGVSSPPPWAKLSGRLKGNSALWEGSTLVLNSQSGGTSVESNLKTDGSFEFPMILPGSYSGRITPARALAIPPIAVVIPEGRDDIQNLEITLPRVVEVSGHIAVEGSRRPSLTLMFTSAAGTSNVYPLLDGNGNFALQVPEGPQSVAVRVPSGLVLKAFTYGSVDLRTGSVTIPQDGAQFQLTLGLEKPATGVKISGTITNLPTQPRTALTPRLTIQPQEGVRAPVADITVTPDGKFEISPVPPGTYRLTVMGMLSLMSGTTTVTVGNLDLTGIEIPIPNSVAIKGRVTLDGGGPLPNVAVQLRVARGPTSTHNATPRPDGSFTINLPEGEFSASMAARVVPAGYTLSTLKYGEADLLKEALKITATNPAELIIEYKSAGVTGTRYKVSGRITAAAADVNLTLVTSAVGRNAGGQGQLSTTSTAGAFEFSDVLPGRYTIRGTSSQSLRAGNSVRFTVSRPVVVGNSDLRDLQFPIPEVRNVPFQVSVEGGGPVPRLSFQLTNGTDQGSTQGSPINGSFVVPLPVDGWRISVANLPVGYSVKSMTYGSSDLLRDPLKLAESETLPIQLTLSAAATALHKLSGRVTGLVPGSIPRLITLFGTTVSPVTLVLDSEGHFEFANLVQGNYTLMTTAKDPPISVPVTVGNTDVTGLVIDAR
jgi:hypothetical protein